jgi:histidyl-tRNA synthetase
MHALPLAEQLRRLGVSVDIDHRNRSLRKQLAWANQLQARHLLVVGEDEANAGQGKIKIMETGREVDISLDPATIAARLKEGV